MTGIIIKTPSEINEMKKACRMASRTLEETSKILHPGLKTDEINTFVHRYTIERGGIPAPLNYRGYPKSVCTSVNEVVCHGIPGNLKLKDGDIINVDITTIIDGWHGDVSATFFIGNPKPETRKFVEVTKKCLDLAILQATPGNRLGDIGAAIQEHAESHGYSVVRDFVGHGIGKNFHESPQIVHYGKKGRGTRIKRGMVFTIEPMINMGRWQIKTLKDKWTAVTIDSRLSAQFEHTIAITKDGPQILTAFKNPLKNSI